MVALTEANAQVLVNRLSVDTAGHPNLTYRHLALAKGNGNSVYVVGNTYTSGEQENFLVVKYTSGAVSWTQEFNSLTYAHDFGIDATAHGDDLYVAGIKSDSLGADAAIQLISLKQSDGGLNWNTTFYAPSGETAVPTQVLADGDYVYVAGTMETSPGEYGLVVLKYSTAGILKWSAVYDSTGLKDGAAGIKLRGSSVIVTGASGSSTSSWDMVTLTIDSNGTITKTTRSSNGNGSFSQAVDMAQDASNNTYVLGAASSGGINLDYKLIKYDSAFNEVWVRTWGDSLPDEPRAMEMDAQGNYVITGYTTQANGTRAMATLKYAPNGNLLWSNIVPGGCAVCSAEGVDIHTVQTLSMDTNVYVTGKMFNGTDYDYLTVSYSPSGELRWLKTYDSGIGTNDEAQDIVMDDIGTLYISGTSTNPTDTSYLTVRYYQADIYQLTDLDSANAAFAFFENRGQLFTTDSTKADSVFYYTTAGNIQCFVGDKRLSYVFGSTDTSGQVDTLYRVDFTVGGAGTNTRAKIFEDRQAAHHLNYFLGQLERPITRVRGYNRLVQKNVYRGIDWQLYSGASGLRNYYVVSPTEDPTQIRIKYHGVDSTTVLNKKLTVHTKLGTMAMDTLVAYTIDSIGNKTFISVNYTSTGANEYGFTFGSYVTSRTLVVVQYNKNQNDEVTGGDNLEWSTYLGGLGYDEASAIDIDEQGIPFVGGTTSSDLFPTAQGTYVTTLGYGCTFVSKFNENNQLLWSTFYGDNSFAGGGGNQSCSAIAVGSSIVPTAQTLYVTGSTASENLPTPLGNYSAADHNPSYLGGWRDIYLAKFSAFDGNLLYGTYLGGNFYDDAYSLLLNKETGELFLGGATESTDFDYVNTLSNNFYDDEGLGIIMQFDDNMNVIWCTGFGSNALSEQTGQILHGSEVRDLKFDNVGNLVIVGHSPFEFNYNITLPDVNSYTQGHICTSGYVPYNAFIAKFLKSTVSPTVTKFNLYYYSEFGGLSPNEATSSCVDNEGNMYLAGFTLGTTSMQFLQSNGGYIDDTRSFSKFDGFICKFDPDGILLWSTLLGSPVSQKNEFINDIDVDSDGNLFVYGNTNSANFPLNSYNFYYHDNSSPNLRKSYIAMFDKYTYDHWITYFGGLGNTNSGSIKTYENNDLYICGRTESNQTSNITSENYPLRYLTSDYKQTDISGITDGYIARFNVDYIVQTNIDRSVKKDEKYFNIYPNPTEGVIYITPLFENIDEINILITNSLGQVILYSQDYSLKNPLDISGMPNGFYFVNIENNAVNYSGKIILNR